MAETTDPVPGFGASGPEDIVGDELTIHVPIMKDCIKRLLDKGCADFLYDWKQGAIWITMEEKRLGKPEHKVRKTIEDWATRSGVGKQTVRREVAGLVQWVFEKAGELGCEGVLRESGFCITQGNPGYCEYHSRYWDQIRARKSARWFNEDGWIPWKTWLPKNEKKHGYLAVELYQIVREIEHFQGAIVYKGYRGFVEEIRNRFRKWNPVPMDIVRAVKVLETYGLLRKVSQGKRGKRSPVANGYQRVLPIPGLPDGT